MKNLLVALLTFTLLFSLSCSKEVISSTENEDNVPLLKRILHFDRIEDTIPRYFYEYQYDLENNLEKIFTYQGNPPRITDYTIFEYNSKNQLTNRLWLSYINENESFIYDSTHFQYNMNGNLIMEEISFLAGTQNKYIKIIYEYNDDQLTKKKTFENNSFENCVVYEKIDDYTSVERLYLDTLNTELYQYTTNRYSNELLIRKKIYVVYEPEDEITEINYTYDIFRNPIIREVKHSDYLNNIHHFYIEKYEYY